MNRLCQILVVALAASRGFAADVSVRSEVPLSNATNLPSHPGPAENTQAGNQAKRFERETTEPFEREDLKMGRPSTILLGTKVKDLEGKTLGRLQDLVLDLPTGQVLLALVSLGSRAQMVPVPALSFSAADADVVLLNTHRQTFENAPRIPRTAEVSRLDRNVLDAAYRCFGQTPPPIPSSGFGALSSADGLRGKRLLGARNDLLGKVEDLVVALPVGRVVYVVVKPSVDVVTSPECYIVPPGALKLDAARETLMLNADRAYFLAGPCFQMEFSAEMLSPALANAVQQHYGTQLGGPDGTAGREFVRSRVEASPSQGTPDHSDRQIADAVMEGALRYARPFELRNFRITTVNGRVTLSGDPPISKRQRRLIVQAAQQVAGAANVENRLGLAQ